jgi:transcriptional regulator with XRE-family HTH domain
MARLARFLDANGVTQTEVAQALGVEPPTISRKLGGIRPWRLAEIQQLLAFLTQRLGRQVSYDELLGAEEPAEPEPTPGVRRRVP